MIGLRKEGKYSDADCNLYGWLFVYFGYASKKELADQKAKEDKERTIKELKNRIEADSKRLAELESM